MYLGYQQFMFPILKFLNDEKIHYKKDIFAEMIKVFNSTPEQIEEKIPSQSEPTYINRISCAIIFLKFERPFSYCFLKSVFIDKQQ